MEDLFTIHQYENNTGSQQHLNQNRLHFSEQCRRVYGLLLQGNVLTVSNGINMYQVQSLPRRILDLKQKGVKISDRWSTQHKIKIKEYFMSGDDITYNKTHHESINNSNSTQNEAGGLNKGS